MSEVAVVALRDAELSLTPMTASDIPALTRAASDPAIWAGHPATDRWQAEVFEPYAQDLLRWGGTLSIRMHDEVVGCTRYYPCPDAPGDIGIGFTFLTRACWGGAVNWRMKRLMVDHALRHVPRIWFHIAPTNVRSQKATQKLGAVYCDTRPVDLGGGAMEWQRWCLMDGDVILDVPSHKM